MENRRSFLKKSGLSLLALELLNDPFIQAAVGPQLDSPDCWIRKVTEGCTVHRKKDFLSLEFFFVNLSLNSLLGRLVLTDHSKKAYLLVRLRQQHVGEERKTLVMSPVDCSLQFGATPRENFSFSYISGFSYLTLGVPAGRRYLTYSADNLLDWSQFDLVHLPGGEVISPPVKMDPTTYPITDFNYPAHLLADSVKGHNVPLTLLEVPYKLFLTPVVPETALGDKNPLYYFEHANNPRKYWSDDLTHRTLYELWSNSIAFRSLSPSGGIRAIGPDFKVVGYEDTPDYELDAAGTKKAIDMLPEPAPDRKQLAYLTNLVGPSRNVTADSFNFSTLGTSTFLHYKNMDPQGYAIVDWKQDIKLGRDNYVEIITRAIDLRTGLKLLVSDISERRVESGRSLLIKRSYFKYLEKIKDFSTVSPEFNNCPFKTITPLEEESFFKPLYLSGAGSGAYIPCHECSPGNLQDMLNMKYAVTDAEGNNFNIQLDLCIISETDFNNYALLRGSIQMLNKLIATNDYFKIDMGKSRFAYAKDPKASPTGADKTKNHSNAYLVTDAVQLYPIVNGDNVKYTDVCPIRVKLKYAFAPVSQLEGIETVARSHFLSYSNLYTQEQFNHINGGQIFFRILDDSIKGLPVDQITEGVIVIPGNTAYTGIGVLKQIDAYEAGISGVFTEAYKNIGSLVNPDIVINTIALTDQSIMHTEKTSLAVGSSVSTPSLRPADLLRGMNVEIFGGIDLLQILKQVIGLEDSPIFNVVDQARDGIEQLQQLSGAIKANYKDAKQTVSTLMTQLENAKQEALQFVNNPLAQYTNSFLAKRLELQRLSQKLEKLASGDTQTIADRLYKAVADYTANFYTLIAQNLDAYDKKIKGLKASLLSIDNYFTKKADSISYLLLIKQCTDQLAAHIVDIQAQVLAGSGAYTEADLDHMMALNVVLQQSFSAFLQQAATTLNLIADFPVIGVTEIVAPYLDIYFSQWIFSLSLRKVVSIDGALLATAAYYTTSASGATITVSVNDALVQANLIDKTGHFTLSADISGWVDFLGQQQTQLQQWISAALYKLIYTSATNVQNEVSQYLNKLQNSLQSDINVLKTQVNSAISQASSNLGLLNQIEATRQYASLRESYYHYQNIYHRFNDLLSKGKDLVLQAPPNIDLTTINQFVSKYQIDVSYYHDTLPKKAQAVIDSAIATLDGAGVSVFDPLKNKAYFHDWNLVVECQDDFASYQQLVDSKVNDLIGLVNLGRQKALNEVVKLQSQLNTANQTLQDFFTNLLKSLEDQLNIYYGQLAALAGTAQEILQQTQQIQGLIDNVKADLSMLRTISSKTISYHWETSEFNDVNLGIITFVTSKQPKTSLAVDLSSTIHFDLTHFPPAIKNTEFSVKTALTDFAIDFLGILNVDFNSVSFSKASGQADQFKVQIKGVSFDGPLNFVQVFQSFLQTLDKGLRLDITDTGALLGYDLVLPDISGGAFNFLNAKLTMALRLPFTSGVPMHLDFGFCSPQDLFLLSAGIYGGRGCLVIGVEPKRGIVSIQLIIEFGAVLDIDLGVAQGSVYLFAGIYINKQYDNVFIDGYVTCGGNLSILDLVSASITFYLGLEGNGKYMEGYCSISYEIDIGSFFSITVSMSMYKRIYGSPDNSQAAPASGVYAMSGNGGGEMALHGPHADGDGPYDLTDDPVSEDILPNDIDLTDHETWTDYFGSYYHKVK